MFGTIRSRFSKYIPYHFIKILRNQNKTRVHRYGSRKAFFEPGGERGRNGESEGRPHRDRWEEGSWEDFGRVDVAEIAAAHFAGREKFGYKVDTICL